MDSLLVFTTFTFIFTCVSGAAYETIPIFLITPGGFEHVRVVRDGAHQYGAEETGGQSNVDVNANSEANSDANIRGFAGDRASGSNSNAGGSTGTGHAGGGIRQAGALVDSQRHSRRGVTYGSSSAAHAGSSYVRRRRAAGGR